jgi:hypothetical protein
MAGGSAADNVLRDQLGVDTARVKKLIMKANVHDRPLGSWIRTRSPPGVVNESDIGDLWVPC